MFADLYFPWSLLLPAALALVPWRHIGRRQAAKAISDIGKASPGRPNARLLLGLWIVVIVAFFSLSKGQQDLYVLPFVVAGAALVGGLLDGWLAGAQGERLGRVTTSSVAFVPAVFVLIGPAVLWLSWGPDSRLDLAGALPSGILVALSGVAALVALGRAARLVGVATLAAGLIAAHWLLVTWALPDFERYKPVPHLARAIERQSARPPAVGIYKVAAPSLVFYLRRHLDQMFTEDELRAFFDAHPDGVCVMPEEEFKAIGAALPVPPRVVASARRFDARLGDFLARTPARRLVLVTLAPVT